MVQKTSSIMASLNNQTLDYVEDYRKENEGGKSGISVSPKVQE